MFHDWFGSHYKVSTCDEEGYSFVSVKTSPDAMVAFALQYSDRIEVMDEEIRQKIREKIELLGGKYGDKEI